MLHNHQKTPCSPLSFNLTYGAIDMAVTPDGEYLFFEVNASGQFQWIEYATGLPITEALVNQLIEGAVKE